jgi:hypothetical protein
MHKIFDYILYAASTLFCLGLIGTAGYFWFYPTIITVLVSLLGILGWQTWKLARIVLIFEDDLNNAIEALGEAKESLGAVAEMKLFFDSDEIQHVVSEAMESLRMAEFKLNQTIQAFVDRSKQKYIIVVENEEEDPQHEEGQRLEVPQAFAGPPPTKEGTIANVRSSRPRQQGRN